MALVPKLCVVIYCNYLNDTCYQSNYVGESEASQIINTRTVGAKPKPPKPTDFLGE